MLNRKALERKAGAWAFGWGQRRYGRMSWEQAERSGERLGNFIFLVSAKHRKRARANLAMAMPELSAEEREKIVRGVFRHFGRVVTDFLRSPSRSAEEALASVEVEGIEHYEEAKALNKGILFVTGHIGNWERGAQWFKLNYEPLHVVARDANDPELQALVAKIREQTGAVVLSRGNAMRGILQVLRANKPICLLPDQNAEEVFVPFFGKMAGSVQGPAVINDRTGAPVLAVYCMWVGPGKFRYIVEPMLQRVEGYEDVPEGMTRAIARSLEARIREYPEQWLWIHDRWRSARRRGLL